ncbi:protein Simiate-like [Dendronephthya gigantea]|uniref:protein Simiate-like n=1 Tax=Dendronephthya gigantea TaxID=151771 RepID=UPI00106A0187|nr:protein Simiate-like [Dendronephthya gigantea]
MTRKEEKLKMASEGGKIFPSKYRSVLERYFKKFYKINVGNVPFADQCVLQHSNKICIVTVAPRHPLLSKGEVIKVDFQVSKNVNRLDNKVSGKGKRGAQILRPHLALCDVTCSTGEKYTLYSCIRGKLVEVNESLVTNPSLLNEKPMTEGYIAVVLPKLHEVDEIVSELVTEADYEVLLNQDKTLAMKDTSICKNDEDNN